MKQFQDQRLQGLIVICLALVATFVNDCARKNRITPQRAAIEEEADEFGDRGPAMRPSIQPKKSKTAGFNCKELMSSAEVAMTGGKPTVLVFVSDTCGACSVIEEPVNKVIAEHGSRINIRTVNTSNPAVRPLAEALKVSSVPQVVVITKLIGAFTDNGFYKSELQKMIGVQAMTSAQAPSKPKTAAAQSQQEMQKVLSQKVERDDIEGESGEDKSLTDGVDDEDVPVMKPTATPLSITPAELSLVSNSSLSQMNNQPRRTDVMP